MRWNPALAYERSDDLAPFLAPALATDLAPDLAPIDVPADPNGLAYDRDRETLYVTDGEDGAGLTVGDVERLAVAIVGQAVGVGWYVDRRKVWREVRRESGREERRKVIGSLVGERGVPPHRSRGCATGVPALTACSRAPAARESGRTDPVLATR